MPRSGKYIRRGEPVVLHDAVTSLPAPSPSASGNLPDDMLRHDRYVIRLEAAGAQTVTDGVLWARTPLTGTWDRVLGLVNGGAPVELAAGLGATLDIDGGDWDGIHLQGGLSTGAAVTVTIAALYEEG
jgi:hypothetical protein